ncbi:co-chaperone GroES [Candidatus Wolfebacteria bacterium]|nr:co-chaperone GroES [Candidatus Wolfebacteria bacterium]
MNLKPLNKHIVLEAVEVEKTTASGIVIPETADKEKTNKGKVVAVSDNSSLKVGDVVFFEKFSDHTVKDGDKEYIIVKEENILAVLN